MAKRDRLRTGMKKNELLSTTYVEETAASPAVGGRAEVFGDDFLISLEDLYSLEMRGKNVKIEEQESDSSKLAETIVRRSIDRLPKLEREIIIRYYFQGYTCKQIAESLHKDEHLINNLRLRAIEKIKRLISEEKKNIGLTSDFNQCVLCSHSEAVTIDTVIHTWLDSHDWKTFGLAAHLTKAYNFSELDKKTVDQHIQFHMGVEDDISILSKLPVKKSNKVVQLNVSVTADSNKLINELSSQYGITKPFIIRQAVFYGLIHLSSMLEVNEKLFVEQIKLTSFVRRINT